MYSVDIQTTKVIAKKSFKRFIMRQKRVSSLTFRILQLPLVIERFSSSQASAKLAGTVINDRECASGLLYVILPMPFRR